MRTVESYLSDISGDRGEKIRKFHEEHLKFFNQAAGSGHNHQAWEGGYRTHLEQCLHVADMVIEDVENGFFKGRDLPDVEWESVVVALYFHDIEKMYKYSQLNAADGFNSGTFDKMNFLKYVLSARWDITLTEEELNAVYYIHGEDMDYQKDKRVMTRLCAVCHMADICSARILFDVGQIYKG